MTTAKTQLEAISLTLRKYLPEKAIPQIAQWILDCKVAVRITQRRRSVLGTYRSPHGKSGHQITINGDLNPYAFLITFVHEFAHLQTWVHYRHTVLPHGREWKRNYQQAIHPFFQLDIFPPNLKRALLDYMANPAAATCRDEELNRVLREYDTKNATTKQIYVADLQPNALFTVEDGRVFRRGEKLRKYFRCVDVKTNKTYRVNGLMTVVKVE